MSQLFGHKFNVQLSMVKYNTDVFCSLVGTIYSNVLSNLGMMFLAVMFSGGFDRKW